MHISTAQNLIGYELEAADDTFGRCHLDVGPQRMNMQEIVHGSIISVLLDTASGVLNGCPPHMKLNLERS